MGGCDPDVIFKDKVDRGVISLKDLVQFDLHNWVHVKYTDRTNCQTSYVTPGLRSETYDVEIKMEDSAESINDMIRKVKARNSCKTPPSNWAG